MQPLPTPVVEILRSLGEASPEQARRLLQHALLALDAAEREILLSRLPKALHDPTGPAFPEVRGFAEAPPASAHATPRANTSEVLALAIQPAGWRKRLALGAITLSAALLVAALLSVPRTEPHAAPSDPARTTLPAATPALQPPPPRSRADAAPRPAARDRARPAKQTSPKPHDPFNSRI